jgi:hypothetical protein
MVLVSQIHQIWSIIAGVGTHRGALGSRNIHNPHGCLSEVRISIAQENEALLKRNCPCVGFLES